MADRPPTFDHLRKKPLEQRVVIYLDDDPIEALEDARAELAENEARAEQTYQRRLALARQANPTPSEVLAIEAGLDGERAETLTPYRRAVEQAEEAVRQTAQTFVFRSPGKKAFEDLIAEHPPTDDDHEDTRKMTGRPEALARWHTDSFAPALLAACCVDPKLAEDEAAAIYTDWTDAEAGQLFAAALGVCQGARQVDLGKASRAASKRA